MRLLRQSRIPLLLLAIPAVMFVMNRRREQTAQAHAWDGEE